MKHSFDFRAQAIAKFEQLVEHELGLDRSETQAIKNLKHELYANILDINGDQRALQKIVETYPSIIVKMKQLLEPKVAEARFKPMTATSQVIKDQSTQKLFNQKGPEQHAKILVNSTIPANGNNLMSYSNHKSQEISGVVKSNAYNPKLIEKYKQEKYAQYQKDIKYNFEQISQNLTKTELQKLCVLYKSANETVAKNLHIPSVDLKQFEQLFANNIQKMKKFSVDCSNERSKIFEEIMAKIAEVSHNNWQLAKKYSYIQLKDQYQLISASTEPLISHLHNNFNQVFSEYAPDVNALNKYPYNYDDYSAMIQKYNAAIAMAQKNLHDVTKQCESIQNAHSKPFNPTASNMQQVTFDAAVTKHNPAISVSNQQSTISEHIPMFGTKLFDANSNKQKQEKVVQQQSTISEHIPMFGTKLFDANSNKQQQEKVVQQQSTMSEHIPMFGTKLFDANSNKQQQAKVVQDWDILIKKMHSEIAKFLLNPNSCNFVRFKEFSNAVKMKINSMKFDTLKQIEKNPNNLITCDKMFKEHIETQTGLISKYFNDYTNQAGNPSLRNAHNSTKVNSFSQSKELVNHNVEVKKADPVNKTSLANNKFVSGAPITQGVKTSSSVISKEKQVVSETKTPLQQWKWEQAFSAHVYKKNLKDGPKFVYNKVYSIVDNILKKLCDVKQLSDAAKYLAAIKKHFNDLKEVQKHYLENFDEYLNYEALLKDGEDITGCLPKCYGDYSE